MENALDAFRAISGTDEAKNALSLIQVYFIVKDPQNQKFRRIRISNPKFYASIWQLEQARTFLLLSGFEQEGEFLVLPSSIKLDGTKLLLDEAFGVSSANEARKHDVSGSLHTNDKSTVLKLNSQKVDSLFDQDIKADLTLLSYMKEMGYNVTVAEKALIATKNGGVQPAIDWINQNPYEEIVKLQQVEVVPQENTEGTSKFSNNSNTFDSRAHVQPAPVSRYQKTIAERHKFQEKVRLEAIEEAKLEKQRKKLQREYLLKDLKDEKDEKLEKAKHAKLAAESSSETSTCAPVDQTVHDGESLLIDLKIRLPDGEVLSISLSSDSTIETLYQEVRKLWPENGEQQVSRLGRRAALVVQRLHEQGRLTQGGGTESDSNNGKD
ncbi:uncharacterized protein LOC141875514 isoform X2 [Acropora palmata]|uniref:uncharacterized protein LOC141875514 isoform X2 n=1 Tax=Acropora palmata TaxID=6131 RepID=UPI003DA02C3E